MQSLILSVARSQVAARSSCLEIGRGILPLPSEALLILEIEGEQTRPWTLLTYFLTYTFP